MSDDKKIMKTLNGYTVYDEDAHRRIDSLAGSAPGLVFDTVADMEAYVAEHSAELKVGQNLYIREVDVPDYWWDGTAVQELETKVDLSGYAKQAEVDLLSEAIADKANKAGWTANKYIGTDESGNMVEKDAPTGGGTGTVTSVNGNIPDENGNVTVEVGQPTDEQIATAVEGWLDEHPEATTTVADGSITAQKMVDGAVTSAKLHPSATDERYFDPYMRVTYTIGGINDDGTINESANYRLSCKLPVVAGETIWLNSSLTSAVAFYDKNGDFLSKLKISGGLKNYTVPVNAEYAIYQNDYSNGAVPTFFVRKKQPFKNRNFADLILSPEKTVISVGLTGDSNTKGYGLSDGEKSWAELMMEELEKIDSVRFNNYSPYIEILGAHVYGQGLNFRAGSQITLWTDATWIELNYPQNYDSAFTWYKNGVEIADSAGVTELALDGEYSEITVKFTAGQMVNPGLNIPKTITHTNDAVVGVGAGNLTIKDGYDWFMIMVGTNDRNMLNKSSFSTNISKYSGKGTFIVPFPNHKVEESNIITQAQRFGEYRAFMECAGYEIIDCSDVNAWAFYDDSLYQTDKIHFSAKGHRVMCNMISGKIGLPVMLNQQ